MLTNEVELRCSIEWLAKFYTREEKEATEPAWDEDTRAMMAEQTHHLRLKIEREVAEFLAKKYGYARAEERAQEAMPVEPLAQLEKAA